MIIRLRRRESSSGSIPCFISGIGTGKVYRSRAGGSTLFAKSVAGKINHSWSSRVPY
jgi:hypothetical protein